MDASARKKLLIITYHWPPMGGGGVQRWLKMSKYLRDYGWEPVIFTVDDAEISIYDESLLAEIPPGIETLRVPIWEPFNIYKSISGKKKEEKVQPGLLDEGEGRRWIREMALWIRGNIFIPDAKMFWIKPATAFLKRYLAENPVDAMVSSGPPHTTHLIALRIRQQFKIRWMADFRDPWTFVDYYDKLKLSRLADRRHHNLERKVINGADLAVTVSWSWAEEFNARNFNKKVEVITNGYDPADFSGERPAPDRAFSITHIGSMNADRNPTILWEVLKGMGEEIPGFRENLQIKLIGPVDHSVFQSVAQWKLEDKLTHIKNLPHSEVIPHLQRSAVLLLPLNNTFNISGVVPGKLFEYLGAERPILCIGSRQGDAARILREAEAGEVLDFTDTDGLQARLTTLYQQHLRGESFKSTGNFSKYSRKTLAGAVCRALEGI